MEKFREKFFVVSKMLPDGDELLIDFANGDRVKIMKSALLVDLADKDIEMVYWEELSLYRNGTVILLPYKDKYSRTINTTLLACNIRCLTDKEFTDHAMKFGAKSLQDMRDY